MSTTTSIATTLVSTTPQARVGDTYTEFTAKKGKKVWIYVMNDEAATAFAAGNVVSFPDGADEYDEVKLSTAAAANSSRVVGVAQHAIAAQSYGWILREGEGTIKADSQIAANLGIIVGGGAAGTADPAGAITDQCIGWAHTLIAAGATGLARIRCWG
jgi:hypothetical protein